MVAKRICQIPVTDLKVIRVTIKGIVVEIPLDLDAASAFLGSQLQANEISQHTLATLLGLVSSVAEAQQIAGDANVEFVVPADD